MHASAFIVASVNDLPAACKTEGRHLKHKHKKNSGFIGEDEFRELLKYVFDKRYNFLFVDRQEQTFCKNFNRLKLEPAE